MRAHIARVPMLRGLIESLYYLLVSSQRQLLRNYTVSSRRDRKLDALATPANVTEGVGWLTSRCVRHIRAP
jgi:hypothetical protein